MPYYYALEHNDIVNGHYIYLDDILEDPDTHKITYYSTTDKPADAMHWDTDRNARKFMDNLPFKDSFHVQRMYIAE